MSEPLRIALVAVLVLAVLGISRGALPDRPTAVAGGAPGTVDVDAVRPEPLRFAAGTTPGNQRVVLEAIAAARPEARALIDAVDGLVELAVGPTGDTGSVGYTLSRGNDDFRIVVDLDRVYSENGIRGIRRTVLHEFGHVIDRAIVPRDLMARLDAGIPRGYECPPGEPTGACATGHERFAESFAKWAMNDIGADIYIGYKVPPPAMPLDDWGRPLAALAR